MSESEIVNVALNEFFKVKILKDDMDDIAELMGKAIDSKLGKKFERMIMLIAKAGKSSYASLFLQAYFLSKVCETEESKDIIQENNRVSMNMWAAYPEFLEFLAEDFKTFLSEVEEGDLKKEYLLPNIVDKLLKEGRANVKVLETQDRWFGVTYQEDKEAVQEAFAGLIKEGVYPANLWG